MAIICNPCTPGWWDTQSHSKELGPITLWLLTLSSKGKGDIKFSKDRLLGPQSPYSKVMEKNLHNFTVCIVIILWNYPAVFLNIPSIPPLPCCSTISPATRMVLIKSYGLDHGENRNERMMASMDKGHLIEVWGGWCKVLVTSRHLKAQIVKILLEYFSSFWEKQKYRKNHGTTVDGQNPAPPRMMIIPLFIGF